MTYLFIGIGAFVAIIVILNILPKHFHTERTLKINKGQGEILSFIADFSNYQSWNPWFRLDSNIKSELTGTNGAVGSTYSWDCPNKQVGTGSQTITAITSSEVKYDIAFTKPMKSQAKVYLKVEGDENTSTVSWGFDTKGSVFMGFFFNPDKMVAPKYEEGLKYLKEILEK